MVASLPQALQSGLALAAGVGGLDQEIGPWYVKPQLSGGLQHPDCKTSAKGGHDATLCGLRLKQFQRIKELSQAEF